MSAQEPPGRTAGGPAPMTAGGPLPGVAGSPSAYDPADEPDPPEAYSVHLEDIGGRERTLTAILSVDIVRQHSDTSDWQVKVPRDETLREWAHADVDLRHRGETLMSGDLQRVSESESSEETTLEGFGPLGDLRFGEMPETLEGASLYQAIERVWIRWTPFDAVVIPPAEPDHQNEIDLSGDSRIAVLKDLHERAGMRFYATLGDSGPDVVSFPVGEIVRPAGWTRLDASPERDVGDYVNSVIVRGAWDRDLGRHYRGEASDQSEIARVGATEPDILRRPDLESDDECRDLAEQTLSDRLEEDQLTGSLDIAPRAYPPGVRARVPYFDGDTKSIERVTYRESMGEAAGTIDFERPFSTARRVEEVDREVDRTKGAIR